MLDIQGRGESVVKRTQAWLFAIVTAALAVAVNALVENVSGFNISGFVALIVIPVGVIALAAAGLSGFLLGARRSLFKPNAVDFVYLVIVAYSVPLAIYGYHYVLMTADLDVAQRPSFGSFVYDYLTHSMVQIHSRYMETAPPQEAGEYGLIVAWISVGALPAVAKAVHSTVTSWELEYGSEAEGSASQSP